MCVCWRTSHSAQEFLRDEAKVPSLDPGDCVTMMENGEMTLLDVREPEDHSDVHAVGAINVPLYNRLEGISLKVSIQSVMRPRHQRIASCDN